LFLCFILFFFRQIFSVSAEARKFVARAFRDGAMKNTGTDIDKILPPVSRF
jgi:hypothetical protein